MITSKQQALNFLSKKNNETNSRHQWHQHETFKSWVDEMLDEIFGADNAEIDTKIIAQKFGVKAIDELNEIMVGSKAGLKTLAGFIKYRNEIKKPIKTSRPLKQFAQELMIIENAGFELQRVIEIMQNNEWQTIKLEWVQKHLKSSKTMQSTDLSEFGFKSTQELLK
jgi:hypothetical protein